MLDGIRISCRYTQWRFWGFHFWGPLGWWHFYLGHTTNTFALNYWVCNVILASGGLILNFIYFFFGGGTGGCAEISLWATAPWPLGTAPGYTPLCLVISSCSCRVTVSARSVVEPSLLLVRRPGTRFLTTYGIRLEAPPVSVLRWKLHYSRALEALWHALY